MSELRDLARWVVELKREDVPEEIIQSVRDSIFDSTAASIAGSEEMLVKDITEKYTKISGRACDVSIWGQDKKVPLLTGVFLNALSGHMMEMDDVHTESKTHIGTVVIPAAWAVAEYMGADGEALLMAVLCAYEGMARIGKSFDTVSHRNLGWHATATAGTFGAAIAAGKLLKLDVEQMVSALGMAGTQSFGRWAFIGDGSTCKILHPARAAANGVEAALLASVGMTGPEHILDARDGGLMSVFSSDPKIGLVSEGLSKVWEITRVDRKPYPCCRSTHCGIEAASELYRRGLRPEDVDSITVETYEIGYKQCGFSEGSINPSTSMEARFSTPFTSACSLLYGHIGLDTFSPEKIACGEVRKLCSKIRVVPSADYTSAYPLHWGCRMVSVKTNGEQMISEVGDASGSILNPLTRQQLISKAAGMFRDAEGLRADRLWEAINSLCAGSEIPCLFHVINGGN